MNYYTSFVNFVLRWHRDSSTAKFVAFSLCNVLVNLQKIARGGGGGGGLDVNAVIKLSFKIKARNVMQDGVNAWKFLNSWANC
jgi:hypothetical protein